MPRLPKLTIEEVDLDLIRYIFSRGDVSVIMEGQLVNSYDDFVKLYSEEPYKSRESIKIELVHVISGG